MTSKNPTGTYNPGNGDVRRVEGKIQIIEGIRPGVVAVSWHFGQWTSGSRDVVVDGSVVKGDPRRGRGMVPNPVMLEDAVIGNVCLIDPVGGSSMFFRTPVMVTRA